MASPLMLYNIWLKRKGMAEEVKPVVANNSDSAGTKATSTVVREWKAIALATYYSLVVSLGGSQFGFLIAFSSPLLDDFQTHLPADFAVWSGFNQCVYQDLIGPIGPAGAVFGSIFSSPVVAVTGFVTGLIVMSSLSVAGWLLMAVSYFTYHGGAWSAVWFRTMLLLGRLLTGVGAGWAAGVVPVGVSSCSVVVVYCSMHVQKAHMREKELGGRTYGTVAYTALTEISAIIAPSKLGCCMSCSCSKQDG